MEIHTNNLVSINGRYVGRIDKDSYQMRTGIKGKTTFFTGKIGTFNTPHEIDDPLYVPAVPGSVSDWNLNPDFISAVEEIVK